VSSGVVVDRVNYGLLSRNVTNRLKMVWVGDREGEPFLMIYDQGFTGYSNQTNCWFILASISQTGTLTIAGNFDMTPQLPASKLFDVYSLDSTTLFLTFLPPNSTQTTPISIITCTIQYIFPDYILSCNNPRSAYFNTSIGYVGIDRENMKYIEIDGSGQTGAQAFVCGYGFDGVVSIDYKCEISSGVRVDVENGESIDSVVYTMKALTVNTVHEDSSSESPQPLYSSTTYLYSLKALLPPPPPSLSSSSLSIPLINTQLTISRPVDPSTPSTISLYPLEQEYLFIQYPQNFTSIISCQGMPINPSLQNGTYMQAVVGVGALSDMGTGGNIGMSGLSDQEVYPGYGAEVRISGVYMQANDVKVSMQASGQATFTQYGPGEPITFTPLPSPQSTLLTAGLISLDPDLTLLTLTPCTLTQSLLSCPTPSMQIPIPPTSAGFKCSDTIGGDAYCLLRGNDGGKVGVSAVAGFRRGLGGYCVMSEPGSDAVVLGDGLVVYVAMVNQGKSAIGIYMYSNSGNCKLVATILASHYQYLHSPYQIHSLHSNPAHPYSFTIHSTLINGTLSILSVFTLYVPQSSPSTPVPTLLSLHPLPPVSTLCTYGNETVLLLANNTVQSIRYPEHRRDIQISQY
jgi:hypothetical protein